MTPLVIGFFLLVATLVGVVVDASAAYLHRQRLDGLADGAALAAADAISLDAVYAGGLGERAVLDPAAARAAAADYLRATAPVAGGDLTSLGVDVAVDGARVTVRVSAPLELPLGVPGAPRTPRIAATATADATVG